MDRAYAATEAPNAASGEPLLNSVNSILDESIGLGAQTNAPARGVVLESNARTLRELIFGLRNQINRLPAI